MGARLLRNNWVQLRTVFPPEEVPKEDTEGQKGAAGALLRLALVERVLRVEAGALRGFWLEAKTALPSLASLTGETSASLSTRCCILLNMERFTNLLVILVRGRRAVGASTGLHFEVPPLASHWTPLTHRKSQEQATCPATPTAWKPGLCPATRTPGVTLTSSPQPQGTGPRHSVPLEATPNLVASSLQDRPGAPAALCFLLLSPPA